MRRTTAAHLLKFYIHYLILQLPNRKRKGSPSISVKKLNVEYHKNIQGIKYRQFQNFYYHNLETLFSYGTQSSVTFCPLV